MFTREALALIAQYSEGIPRNINNLCFNSLSLGCALKQKTIDCDIVREVVADLDLDRWRTKSSLAVRPEERARKRPRHFFPLQARPPCSRAGFRNSRLPSWSCSSFGSALRAVAGRPKGCRAGESCPTRPCSCSSVHIQCRSRVAAQRPLRRPPCRRIVWSPPLTARSEHSICHAGADQGPQSSRPLEAHNRRDTKADVARDLCAKTLEDAIRSFCRRSIDSTLG